MRSACTQGAARGGILCGNLRRGGIRDDAAAIFASARPHLNEAIRIRHNRKIMLDDDYRMARIRQLVQLGIEQVDIGWVQARGGLIQQIDRVAATRVAGALQLLSLIHI